MSKSSYRVVATSFVASVSTFAFVAASLSLTRAALPARSVVSKVAGRSSSAHSAARARFTFPNNSEGSDGGFVAGGEWNSADAGSFIGAGDTYYGSNATAYGNTATSLNAFIGAGDLNNASGNGAVIVGGDTQYGEQVEDKCSAGTCSSTPGNQATGDDTFIGAGDRNVNSGTHSFEGAGDSNTVSGTDAFVGAGSQNTAAATDSFLGGGTLNDITSAATYASLAGGNNNYISGVYGTIGGGSGNKAEGAFSVVPGGADNVAYGVASFAAGYHAYAANNGSFVWSDEVSGSSPVKDGNKNEFVVRASNGTYFFSNEGESIGVKLAAGSGTWASTSDRNAKTDLSALDQESILSKVAALPIATWSYKTEPGIRHVGPMAQDFYAAFHVGTDDRHVTSIDEDGVALAALKALVADRKTEQRRNRAQQRSLRDVHNAVQLRVEALAFRISSLASEIAHAK